MRKKGKHNFCAVLGITILMLFVGTSVSIAETSSLQKIAAFDRDLAALTVNSHRLAGRDDGSLAAGRYVRKRLESMGVKEIYLQKFEVVMPLTTECRMVAGGKDYKIHVMRANILQASITPADGLVGETMYIGSGKMKNYGGRSANGKIVVLDFDCGKEWVNAFAFGAKAVLFVEKPGSASLPYHHVNIPANFPRFYVTDKVAKELELKDKPRKIQLYSATKWESLYACNVIGVIRGTDPVFKKKKGKQPEAVVLAAPLDSLSEVPLLSPGARDAGNCAALLQIAGDFVKNPPKRDVIVAFFDAQTQNHTGARNFYGALYRKLGPRKLAMMTLEERMAYIDKEEAYLATVQNILERQELFDPATIAMDDHINAVRMTRSIVARIGGEALEKLAPLRIRLNNLQKKGHVDTPESLAEIKRLTSDGASLGVIDKLDVEDLTWNSILRSLNEGTMISDKEYIAKLTQKVISHPDPLTREAKRVLFEECLIRNYKRAIESTRDSCRSRLIELKRKRAETESSIALRDAIGQQRNTIVLHISINLGDRGTSWSFVHGDDTSTTLGNDEEGLYSGVYKTIRQSFEAVANETPDFDVRPVSEMYSSRLFAPSFFVDSGAVARLFTRFNVSIMTLLDPMQRQGLPSDTVQNLDVNVMYTQVVEAGIMLKDIISRTGLGRTFPLRARVFFDEEKWSGKKSFGNIIRQSDIGDPMRVASVAYAVVAKLPALADQLWDGLDVKSAPPGFNRALRVRSKSNGIFEVPPVTRSYGWASFATTFDADKDGNSRGLIVCTTIAKSLSTGKIQEFGVDIAKVRSQSIVGYGFNRIVPTTVMRARSTSRFREDRHLLCESGNILVLFAPHDAHAAKFFNPYGVVLLDNKMTKEGYQGKGVQLGDPFVHTPASFETSEDLHTLNGYRLNLLRKNQIGEDSLEMLHGRAEDIANDAKAIEHESTDQYYGMIASSAIFSRRAYQPLVAVMNDLVTAVVFLLVLAIPFAFAMERLLVGTPHIYRKIAWFGGFFLATFGLLYVVNPAFKMAATPIIIFLAFTIILLSSLVIFIMLRKLEVEMKKMQGRSISAHTVDVSRVSTMAAAVNMGISTMRRRPLRTLLTAVTVILLTFTILTFASFSSMWGNRRTYVGPLTDAPARVLVRDALWNIIPDGTFNTMRGFLTGRAQTVPRYWLAPEMKEVTAAVKSRKNLDVLLANDDLSKIVSISAAIGIDIRDIDQQENLRSCFTSNTQLDLIKTDGIFLPESVSESLGLTVGDIGKKKLFLKGIEFTFAGVLENKFALQTMLDGSSILPVDYKTSTGGAEIEETSSSAQQTEVATFIPYTADKVVIIPSLKAKYLGGNIRAVCIYPANEDELEGIADDIATTTALPTYMGNKDGVHRMFFSKLIEASGFRDLIIPVVLGGLIIFATMLGSVSDREREIYAFSSLGLAPTHVAMLFFAESSIYAVVGGMGGYLLGQVAAKVLSFLSSLGFLSVPPMNFSSMNAIVTIFVVMGIVILSTIYPAMKAARSANPGIQRSWRLPNPVGDVFDINFPFTVSEYDLTGVVSYLKEHFDGFSDASIGVFATIDCRIIRQKENDMLGFSANVALSPFDLGIEQNVVLLSQPSDVEGINEIRILLKRTSGTYGDWMRANKVFINDLRRQFLIWRTIDEDVMQHYREDTIEEWSNFDVESKADILGNYMIVGERANNG